MTFSSLELTRDGPLAELTLTGKRGALGPDFWRELPAALQGLPGVRALIVRGGPDFSVGLDLVRTAPLLAEVRREPDGFWTLLREMQSAVEELAQLPVPTIAAVSGWCIGAGLELALACDLRVCSQEARFSLPEVKLGIVSDLGGLGRLPVVVGEGWARRLALTGESLEAGQAERIGLVSEVLETPTAALSQARALAARMAGFPEATLRGVKQVMNARLQADLRAHYEGAGNWNAEFLDPQLVADALKPGR